MAMTGVSIERIGYEGWRLTLASDGADPTFYVWRDGILIATTKSSIFDVGVPSGEYPVFEVFDDSTETPDHSYPGRVVLQWRSEGAAASHLVEAYEGGAWVEKASVEDTGAGYYRWVSGWLADVTTHQFRVTPVGADGNTGTATSFAVLMVRWPDPPDVALTYASGTAKVTVAAA